MKDQDPLHPILAQALAPLRPPLKACPQCGSMYCGPLRCRFEDTEALSLSTPAYVQSPE